MAFELHEAHYGQPAWQLLGLGPKGTALAQDILRVLAGFSPAKIGLTTLDKTRPTVPELASGTYVVLVDDVLYSGKTLYRALAAVMPTEPARVQVAVLVDRGHRNFPLRPDVVGLELATTLHQYVRVEHRSDGYRAYLDNRPD